MRAFVAVTDNDWFRFLRRQPGLEEVNFWQPGGGRDFRVLDPGQPLLFKLHYPENAIAGGGFLATSSRLPVSIAWDTFGIKNGAASLADMRLLVGRNRHRTLEATEDHEIGCIILTDPFFLDQRHWLPVPADFAKNIVTGKTYDLRSPAGRALWEAVLAARGLQSARAAESVASPSYGEPTLFRPRLGQGGFRVRVTDAYGRRCSITGERTLPVLEAAHIRPLSASGLHRVDNGLLLRSDIHTLFDRSYVTVTPDRRFRVSQRLKADWENGRVYYELDRREILCPKDEADRPSRQELEWHADTVFLD